MNNNFCSTKLRHYFSLYKRHFPEDPKCILEIGVFKGGSLHRLKSEYPNTLIVGFDKDPRCKGAEADGIQVFTGSQTNKRDVLGMLERIPPPDVVIDDGGHRPYQQLKSFNLIWPFLPSGGVYCVEDLIVGYELRWRIWQAMFGGFMDHCHRLVHRMNTDPNSCIQSVAFHPWMVFISKGVNSFQQVVTGSEDCRNQKGQARRA